MEPISFMPWKDILLNPNSAWAVAFILLLIFVMWQNGKREERLTNIIEGTLKEMTTTLTNLNNTVHNVERRLDDIERGDGG
jgi:uncharacterized protein YoxC